MSIILVVWFGTGLSVLWLRNASWQSKGILALLLALSIAGVLFAVSSPVDQMTWAVIAFPVSFVVLFYSLLRLGVRRV